MTFYLCFNIHAQVTRLIPDAKGTTCNQELEPIINTKHSHILRIPFFTEKGILRQWVSRFDIYPYLERFAQACVIISSFHSSHYIIFDFTPHYSLPRIKKCGLNTE